MSENLIRYGDLTPEEQREFHKKGGQASVAARRKKKAAREAAELILSLQPKLSKKQAGTIKALGVDPESDADIQFISLMAIAAKAMNGDISAYTLLRDTAGERPDDKLQISEGVPVIIDDIGDGANG